MKTASLIQSMTQDHQIKIRFSYDMDILKNVQGLPKRVFHGMEDYWTTPLSLETVNLLKNWGFIIDSRLENMAKKEISKSQKTEESGIPGMQKSLFPFQNKGVAFIERKKGRALLADEMGLGKTVQAIAWIQLHKDLKPVIILTPASAKPNWKTEIKMWTGREDVQILTGTKNYPITEPIIILNYDILPDWAEALKELNPQILIADEGHYFKSNSAQRTKAVKRLAKGIPHVIITTGTPILNRPIEIYNAIKIIDPLLLPNYASFTRRYCNAKYNGFGMDVNGASNIPELHNILVRTIMIRRLKVDVLPELPGKLFSFIPIELNNAKEYKEAEMNYIQWILKNKGPEAVLRAAGAEALSQTSALKQLAVKGKIDNAINWIEDFLESDQKLVLFAWHTEIVDKIHERFKDVAVKFNGSCSAKQKEEAKLAFQTDPKVKLFVGNIKAAGVAITLTAASNVAFIELPWTPGDLDQAIDRCHRIGQKDCVNVHYLLAENTIDERIAKILDKKREILEALLNGKPVSQDSLLLDLMKDYIQTFIKL